MIEIIYLRVDRSGIRGMTKSLPQLRRGEIPVKLELVVEDDAFRTPVIEKRVVVEDWREGIDIADVDFKETLITEDEAKLIREQRLARMKQVLEAQGYEITKPE